MTTPESDIKSEIIGKSHDPAVKELHRVVLLLHAAIGQVRARLDNATMHAQWADARKAMLPPPHAVGEAAPLPPPPPGEQAEWPKDVVTILRRELKNSVESQESIAAMMDGSELTPLGIKAVVNQCRKYALRGREAMAKEPARPPASGEGDKWPVDGISWKRRAQQAEAERDALRAENTRLREGITEQHPLVVMLRTFMQRERELSAAAPCYATDHVLLQQAEDMIAKLTTGAAQ